jgi:hypothetical protein
LRPLKRLDLALGIEHGANLLLQRGVGFRQQPFGRGLSSRPIRPSSQKQHGHDEPA